jgi:hypothetical protein
MGKVGIKLNMPGINAIMKGDGIQSVLKTAGDSVASNAGEGYAAEVRTINWIAVCNVYPDSKQAAKDNYKNNSLLKALSSSGLKMTKGA